MPDVAIDTNVFVHLKNPQQNPDSHIDQLLMHLAKSRPHLCVDSTLRIGDEYDEMIGPMIRNAVEEDMAIYLLRYWMNPDLRRVIAVENQGQLMQRIRGVIVEPAEHADRAFVYVSCEANCVLITNDRQHILDRRADLRKATRRLRGADSDFKSSRQAVDEIAQANA